MFLFSNIPLDMIGYIGYVLIVLADLERN